MQRSAEVPGMPAQVSSPVQPQELLAALVSRRSWLIVGALVGVLMAGGLILLRGTRWEASATLVAVAPPRMGGLADNLTSQLLSAASSGMTPSPALLVRFAQFHGVLIEVARSDFSPTRPDLTFIDSLLGPGARELDERGVVDAMRAITNVDMDRTTGTVSIRFVTRDSALARAGVARLIDAVRDAFVSASQAQALQMRIAQAVRLDSAEAVLRRTEESEMRFRAANRVVAPASAAALRLRRIEREVDIALRVYQQVAADVELARSQELERAAAVAVVDPVPSQIPRRPSRSALTLALGMFVGLLAAMGVALLAPRRVNSHSGYSVAGERGERHVSRGAQRAP